MTKKSKPQEQVWIVHVGHVCLAMPTRAAANALLSALTTATIVDEEWRTKQYFKAAQYLDEISFEVVSADRLHLDREKRDDVMDEPLPAKGRPKLSGSRQLLLEGK